uniref:Uncharacterized protein n=1 Tax=viral metagenome TaxID=1070528 RepID=A0A6C0K6N1_9ZZZZ
MSLEQQKTNTKKKMRGGGGIYTIEDLDPWSFQTGISR